MTPERLVAIRALLAAATPGPWSIYFGVKDSGVVGPDNEPIAAGVAYIGWEDHEPMTDENQELIAAAPTIIAELLAEVTRLTEDSLTAGARRYLADPAFRKAVDAQEE